jgi:hypothetical protein
MYGEREKSKTSRIIELHQAASSLEEEKTTCLAKLQSQPRSSEPQTLSAKFQQPKLHDLQPKLPNPILVAPRGSEGLDYMTYKSSRWQ